LDRIVERQHSLWESRINNGVEDIYLHPSPTQQVILLANVPHLTVSGGTGSGKTSLGPFWMTQQMELALGEDALVVGYTEGALRRNVFPSLFPVLSHSAFRGSFSEKNMVYHTPYGDIFFCTNKNPQAIQGIHPAVIWCDEMGSYSLETWKAIKGRMDRPDARLLGTTTPYGENWFLTDFVQRWRNGDPDYKVVYMSSLDNPTYPRDKYYRDQREMTEDEFQMVHEGRIRRRHGLVYADFRKELVVERPVLAKCYLGMDFGLADPNAALVISSESASKYGKQAVTVHEEWYKSGVDDETIAENIFPLIRKYAIDTIFYDAHAGQTALDVRKHLEKTPYFMDNLRWIPMSETIDPGVNAVRTLTRRGELFVDPQCEYTLDEFATYSILNGKPEAKDHNHCLDGLRYCVRGIQLYGDTELDSGDFAVHTEKLTHAQKLFRIRPTGDDLYDVRYDEN